MNDASVRSLATRILSVIRSPMVARLAKENAGLEARIAALQVGRLRGRVAVLEAELAGLERELNKLDDRVTLLET